MAQKRDACLPGEMSSAYFLIFAIAMNKTYTHFSLSIKPKIHVLVIMMGVFAGIITWVELYFGSVEFKDYQPVLNALIGVILLSLYWSSNVITVSEEGIKTYGLFYKEKFLRWDDIKTSGLAEVKSGKIKLLEKAGERNNETLRIFLSSDHSAEITYDFVFTNKQTVYFPYRKDVYELIKQKLI